MIANYHYIFNFVSLVSIKYNIIKSRTYILFNIYIFIKLYDFENLKIHMFSLKYVYVSIQYD